MSQNIYKVTQEIYDILQDGGEVQLGDTVYTWDDSAMYTIVDYEEPTYNIRLSPSAEDGYSHAIEFTKNDRVVTAFTIPYADFAANAHADDEGHRFQDYYLYKDLTDEDKIYIYDSSTYFTKGEEGDRTVLYNDGGRYFEIASLNYNNIMGFSGDEGVIYNDWYWIQNEGVEFNSTVNFNGVTKYNGSEIATKTDLSGYVKMTGNQTIYGVKTFDDTTQIKYIQGGIIETHPESSMTLLPYIMNDLIGLLNRGGTCTTTGFLNSMDNNTLSNWFNGRTNYVNLQVNDVRDIATITIKLPSTIQMKWGCYFGLGFGNGNWLAHYIKYEVGLAAEELGDPTEWSTVFEDTNNWRAARHHYFACGTAGINTIRITLSDFMNTTPRIAGIWAIQGVGSGLGGSVLTRDGGVMYGGIMPYQNYKFTLGTPNNKWGQIHASGIYAEAFHENGTALTDKYWKKSINLTPATDITLDLGSATNRWHNTHSQCVFTDYLVPSQGWTGLIGDSNRPFHSLYVSNIYEDGTKLTEKYTTKGYVDDLINNLSKDMADGAIVNLTVEQTGPHIEACIIAYLIKNEFEGTFIINDKFLGNCTNAFANYYFVTLWNWYGLTIYRNKNPYNADTVPSETGTELYRALEIININEITDEMQDLTNQVDILYKEVQNLKYTAEGVTFTYNTDSSIAFEKTTPLKIGPYAAVEKLSGISYGRDNLINKPDIIISDGWNSVLTKRDANTWRATCSAAGTTSAYYASAIRVPIKYFNKNKCYRFKCDLFAASSTNIPRIIIRYYDAEGNGLGNIVEVNKDSASPLTMDSSKNFINMTTMQGYWDQIAYIGVGLYASSGAECPSGSYVDYKGLYIGEDNEVNIYNPQPTEIVSVGQNLINIPTEIRKDLSYSINCQNGRIYFSGQAKSTGNIIWDLEEPLPAGDYNVSLFNTLVNANEKKIIYGLVTKSPTAKYLYYTPQKANEYRSFHSDYEITGFFIGVGELNLDLTNAEFYPMITKGHDFVPSVFKPYVKYTKTIPSEVLNQLIDYGLGINDTINNYIDFENKKYIRQCASFKYDASKHAVTLVDETETYVRFKIADILSLQTLNTINGKIITNWSNIPPYTNYIEYSNKTYEQIAAQNMNLFVVIKKTNASTVDEFKTYLANHPFAGIYQLKQYEEVDLSEWLTDDEFIPVEEDGTLFVKNDTYIHNLIDDFVTSGQQYGPSYGITWTYEGNGKFTGTGILTGQWTRWGFGKLNTGIYYWNYENENRYIRLYRINEDSTWTYFAPHQPVIIERDNTTIGFIFSCSETDLNTEEPITFTAQIMLIEGTGHPLQTTKTTDFDVLSTITYTQKVG